MHRGERHFILSIGIVTHGVLVDYLLLITHG